jgi:BirA family biotin operon repressor/biotin-[acetyl-CoA-carboxylase] ligase
MAVNEKMAGAAAPKTLRVRSALLTLLRSEAGVISGEVLSRQLAVSRVSVWKHVQKLLESGYRIDSTPKGYRLGHSPDTPYPWEFPGREALIHYFPEVDSTMEIARGLARGECPPMTTVVAGLQKKGRGRLQRPWVSDAGGLYFTVVTRPEVGPQQSGRTNLAASVTLASVLSDTCGIGARVKWPNDILVDDHKLAGLLAEMDAEADRVAFVNVGIGINVNNQPPPVETGAVSLRGLTGAFVPRKVLLGEFLARFEARLESGLGPELIEEWKALNATLGRHVRVATTGQHVEGRAVDVDENGALILETADGSRQRVFYGDCFHMGKGADAFPHV